MKIDTIAPNGGNELSVLQLDLGSIRMALHGLIRRPVVDHVTLALRLQEIDAQLATIEARMAVLTNERAPVGDIGVDDALDPGEGDSSQTVEDAAPAILAQDVLVLGSEQEVRPVALPQHRPRTTSNLPGFLDIQAQGRGSEDAGRFADDPEAEAPCAGAEPLAPPLTTAGRLHALMMAVRPDRPDAGKKDPSGAPFHPVQTEPQDAGCAPGEAEALPKAAADLGEAKTTWVEYAKRAPVAEFAEVPPSRDGAEGLEATRPTPADAREGLERSNGSLEPPAERPCAPLPKEDERDVPETEVAADDGISSAPLSVEDAERSGRELASDIDALVQTLRDQRPATAAPTGEDGPARPL
ncbi:MAG: hypothetical protein AAGF74_12365 [Pseudomonadota bacterium]